MDRRIALPERSQLVQDRKAIKGDFFQANFRVKPQWGEQIFHLQRRASEFVQAQSKRLQLRAFKSDAGGHRMAAMTNQQITALPESARQIKAGYAAAGAPPVNAIASENDRGPVKLLQHARGDDTNHANV